jgi:hypothetical protein
MTRPTVTHDALQFIQKMGRQNFARVGVYALIHAHLAATASGKLTRAGIHRVLNSRSPFAVRLIESTLDAMFETDADGLIVSPQRAPV